jgi:hypothetical protein
MGNKSKFSGFPCSRLVSVMFIILLFALSSNHFKFHISEPEIHDSVVIFLPDSIIAYATALNGIRYRYGGSDKSGFDCSGFTSYVFSKHDIHLPRSSRDQYQVGARLDPQEIKRADLLFFKGRNAQSRMVGHVGIAICDWDDGDDVFFIHASTRGGIKIDSLSNPYYKVRYVGAARIIDAHYNQNAITPKPKVIRSLITLKPKPILRPAD